MDLKKLVSQTLQEIAEGTFEAKTLLPHKISVNPAPDKFDGNLSADGKIICFAEFDVVIGSNVRKTAAAGILCAVFFGLFKLNNKRPSVSVEVRYYHDISGNCPCEIWVNNLKDFPVSLNEVCFVSKSRVQNRASFSLVSRYLPITIGTFDSAKFVVDEIGLKLLEESRCVEVNVGNKMFKARILN